MDRMMKPLCRRYDNIDEFEFWNLFDKKSFVDQHISHKRLE